MLFLIIIFFSCVVVLCLVFTFTYYCLISIPFMFVKLLFMLVFNNYALCICLFCALFFFYLNLLSF